MSDPKPMNVYPDPDGGARSNAYAPSNTTVAVVATLSGGVAVGAAAPGLGPMLLTNALAFLQGAANYPATEASSRALGFHGLTGTSVAVVVFFGSLSVLLQVINLVLGLRMKERLRGLSEKVSQVCRTAGLIK
jgi:uncharacterized membrane protein YtjA (UPF0391 family)